MCAIRRNLIVLLLVLQLSQDFRRELECVNSSTNTDIGFLLSLAVTDSWFHQNVVWALSYQAPMPLVGDIIS